MYLRVCVYILSHTKELGEVDALLENLALGRLGVAKVHHLVHELVDDHKVVADGLLLELLEVLDQYLHNAVQEQYDFRCIRVSFRQRKDFR